MTILGFSVATTRAVAAVLVLMLGGGSAAAQSLQRSDTTLPPEVAVVLGDGMRTELAPLRGALRVNSQDTILKRWIAAMDPLATVTIRVESTFDARKWSAPGVRVWVGFPGDVDHSHHFTAAEAHGQVFRLGGFEAPELLALDKALGPAARGEMNRAMFYAAIADPNGANQLAVTDTSRVVSKTGETLVVLSSASFQAHAYAEYWTRYRYTFLFGRNGDLLGWTRYESRDSR